MELIAKINIPTKLFSVIALMSILFFGSAWYTSQNVAGIDVAYTILLDKESKAVVRVARALQPRLAAEAGVADCRSVKTPSTGRPCSRRRRSAA